LSGETQAYKLSHNFLLNSQTKRSTNSFQIESFNHLTQENEKSTTLYQGISLSIDIDGKFEEIISFKVERKEGFFSNIFEKSKLEISLHEDLTF
jgi:hypothetical protein